MLKIYSNRKTRITNRGEKHMSQEKPKSLKSYSIPPNDKTRDHLVVNTMLS